MSHAATNKSELALLALALALLAAVALRPSIRGNDGVGHYVYLASILRDGDLDFTNEYRDFDSLMAYPFRFSDLPRCPRTGLPSDRYGVGSALLWAPLTVIVHQTLRLLDPAAADAMSPPYGWAVGVSTVLWGSLGLLLLYDRLRREASRLASLATVAGLVLATSAGLLPLCARLDGPRGSASLQPPARCSASKRLGTAPGPRQWHGAASGWPCWH